MPSIIIVGAGIAGVAASTEFAAAGWDVTLLDKAARPGGRCATRRRAAAADSPWFDYGAQYFTARDPAFRALVERDLDAGELARWRPAIGVAERVGDEWRLEPSPDARERLIAPRGLNRWVRHRLAQGGVGAVCGRRVTGAAPDAGGWRVDLADGAGAQRADALLITAPAPQAAAMLGDAATGIAALDAAGYALRACHTLVVAAPAASGCQAAFVHGGRLSWIADNTHKAGGDGAEHLWTLHAAPGYSDAQVDTPAADLAAPLVAEFAAIIGVAERAIRVVRAHRWRYARPGEGAFEPSTRCHVDCERRLALAGDWLAGGRVEGAWLSGRAAACALIRNENRKARNANAFDHP